jgi:hypothetical protein
MKNKRNIGNPIGLTLIIAACITGYLIIQSIANEKTKELMILKTIIYACAIFLLYIATMLTRKKPPIYRNELVMMYAEELDFFHRLKIALPDKLILAQAEFANLVRTRNYIFGKITEWQTSFLICTADSKVIALVMLESKTRDKKEQAWNIKAKTWYAKHMGIPLIIFEYENPPSIDAIKTEFKKLFHEERPSLVDQL